MRFCLPDRHCCGVHAVPAAQQPRHNPSLPENLTSHPFCSSIIDLTCEPIHEAAATKGPQGHLTSKVAPRAAKLWFDSQTYTICMPPLVHKYIASKARTAYGGLCPCDSSSECTHHALATRKKHESHMYIQQARPHRVHGGGRQELHRALAQLGPQVCVPAPAIGPRVLPVLWRRGVAAHIGQSTVDLWVWGFRLNEVLSGVNQM